MTKKDLTGKTYAEVSAQFDKELEAYHNTVNGVEDIETLTSMEKDLMKDMDQVDADLKAVKYPLPASVDYDGEHYSKNDIAKQILYFLNKNEVEWKYTLGLYQLSQLWKKKDFNEISYHEFDSTLRILNQVKYKGFDEWKNILAVNEYLRANHEAYTIDTAVMLLNHQKHQAILDRMQTLEKVNAEVEA